FQAGHLSQVVGVRLTDGRRIVIKIRHWEDRLLGCARVQRALFERGLPAPEPLLGPTRLGDNAVSAEALVDGGEQLPGGPEAAARFAGSLSELIRLAPTPEQVGSLAPSPPWVGWDHPGTDLWPAPDDREGDLNSENRGGWLDALGRSLRERLLEYQ